jgi:UDP-glucose 4-epimerase
MEGTDLVYHLAARVSVPFCQENPLESYEVNLQGTVNVLEAMRLENSDHRSHRAPVRLVFSSSSAVYGAGASQGQKLAEESVSFQLLSLYAAQKWGSEQAIRLYRQTYHLESVIFRYFNVYGRGQKVDSPYSGVISTFASLLKAGRPLTLNGGGRQTRDFVFVKDVVRACLGVMDLSSAECDGQAMNLGSGSAVSIRDLAYKMMRAAGVEVELREAPARSGDILHSLADNWMARDRLQWVPQTSLDLGLRELLFKQPQ